MINKRVKVKMGSDRLKMNELFNLKRKESKYYVITIAPCETYSKFLNNVKKLVVITFP